MSDKSDLLQYARDFASGNEDLYALLGVDATTPKEDIHRAWRKKSLKYHPDKAGAAFDAAKWQQFERARDVLSDADARQIYDAARSAALVREAQRQAMDAKRRQMIEDLEARERGAGKRPRPDDEGEGANALSAEERQRLLEVGRRKMMERQRAMAEALERERQREQEQEKEKRKEEDKVAAPQPVRDGKKGSELGEPDAPPAPPDVRMADAPDVTANGDGDNYDARIADLERRLAESQARKAAKKTAKKKGAPKNRDGADRDAAAMGPGSEPQETSLPTQIRGATESRADKKGPPPVAATASNPAPASSTTAARAPGDFSSTMARLRAAQAEKEAKKKAAQEAAAATGGAV